MFFPRRHHEQACLKTMDQAATLEVKIAHLGMIQGVIARMATDGQTMKALTITVGAAVVALSPEGGRAVIWLSIAGMLAACLFWWQAAYHLHVEQAYRRLYDDVRQDKPLPAFSMEWRTCRNEVPSTFALARRWAVALPFGATLVLLATFAISTALTPQIPTASACRVQPSNEMNLQRNHLLTNVLFATLQKSDAKPLH